MSDENPAAAAPAAAAAERTLEGDESSMMASMECTLDHDVANVAKHFREGEESSMMVVQIMSITGDVFSVDISSDSTVPNDCRRLLADDIIVLLLTR